MKKHKDLILKSAYCYWSREDEGFVVRSVTCEDVIGVGDTEIEAFQVFEDLLDDYLQDATKPRGPEVNTHELHLTISKTSNTLISGLARKHGKSAEEIIELAVTLLTHLEDADTVKITHKSIRSSL